MDRRVERTLRRERESPAASGWSSTCLQIFDAAKRERVSLVGCVRIYEFLSVLIVVLTGHGWCRDG